MLAKKMFASVIVVLMVFSTLTLLSDEVVSAPNIGETINSINPNRGMFWTKHDNGSVERSQYPINYWNSIDSEWEQIDMGIYRDYFGDYYWKNAKNTFETSFKRYSEESRIKATFYKYFDGIRVPSELTFGYDRLAWENSTSSEVISNLLVSEGVVVGSSISYQPFTDCVEKYNITKNALTTAFRFSNISSPTISDVSNLSISGNITKEASIKIYVDGVYWDEVSEIYGDRITFGFSENDTLYELTSISCFDANMQYSSGKYKIENLGALVYNVVIYISYIYISDVTYPLVVDPNWWAINTVSGDIGSDNQVYDAGKNVYVCIDGEMERYSEVFCSNVLTFNNTTTSALLCLEPSLWGISTDSNFTFTSNTNVEEVWDSVGVSPSGFASVSIIHIPELFSDSKCTYIMLQGGSEPYSDRVAYCYKEPGKELGLLRGELVELNLSYDFQPSTASPGIFGATHIRFWDMDDILLSEIIVSPKINSTNDRCMKVEYGGNVLIWYSDFQALNFELDFDYGGNKIYINITNSSYATVGTGFNSFVKTFDCSGGDISKYGVYAVMNYFGLTSGIGIDNVQETFAAPITFYNFGNATADTTDTSKQYRDGTEYGYVYRYDNFEFKTTQVFSTDLRVHLSFYNYTSTNWEYIPSSVIPGNEAGFDGDGDVVIVDIASLNKTIYRTIRVVANLTTTDNTKSPILDYWKVGFVKLKADGSTASIGTNDISMEAPAELYGGVGNYGNIMVKLGDTTWADDPYMRVYYQRSVSQPALNEADWILITDNMYYTFDAYEGGWEPIVSDDDIRIQLGNPNYGSDFAWLWYPSNFTVTFDDYWFKVVVQDVSWYSEYETSRALFLLTSWSPTIYVNGYPIANAGLDISTPAMTPTTFDAEVDIADGGGGISGVDALEYCNWTFTALVGDWNLTQNSTVNSVGDGIVVVYFPDNGTYTARLELIDVHGLKDVDLATITVTNNAPSVIFEVEDVEGTTLNVLNNYFFDARDSTDIDGTMDYYRWYWDDGSDWTNKSFAEDGFYVSHTFDTVGFYNVTLYITDDDNLTGVDIVMYELVIGIPSATIADNVGNEISQTTIQVYQYERFTLSGGLSSAGSGGIIEYSWDFGDGDIFVSSSSYASHIYEVVGTYSVTLEIETTLHYFDDTYCYVKVLESRGGENATLEGGLLGLGTNPRLKFNVTSDTELLELDVSYTLLKEGWGGTFSEKHLFRERVSVSIVRETAAIGENYTVGEGNDTENFTVEEEVIVFTATYFDADINSGDLDYTGSIWDSIYIYIRVAGTWHLCNKADVPSVVTILIDTGSITFTFSGDWDEIRILSNPGLFSKISLWFGSKNFTPSGMIQTSSRIALVTISSDAICGKRKL